MNVSGEAHIHLDALNLGEAHDFTELRVDLCDAPAVSAPSEFKRDQFFSGDDLAATVNTLPQAAMPVAVLLLVAAASYFPGFLKPTPPAQAPPIPLNFL